MSMKISSNHLVECDTGTHHHTRCLCITCQRSTNAFENISDASHRRRMRPEDQATDRTDTLAPSFLTINFVTTLDTLVIACHDNLQPCDAHDVARRTRPRQHGCRSPCRRQSTAWTDQGVALPLAVAVREHRDPKERPDRLKQRVEPVLEMMRAPWRLMILAPPGYPPHLAQNLGAGRDDYHSAARPSLFVRSR